MDTIAVAVFAFAVIASFLARDMLRSRSSQAEPAPGGVEDCMALIRSELHGVRTAVERSDAGLTAQLRLFGQQTASLTETTSALRSVLGSAHARGQWGERMAEDVLRAIGFVEGVNYAKQQTLDGSGARPDFVFPLPGGLRMNMDVKFPLDNYARAAKLPAGAERVELEKAFLRDVRARVREVSSREYVDPEGGTVAYAVLFIPNESVFAYIQEHAPELFEAALRDRVVCCSPLTLFAVLAIVRQTVDSFRLQKASDEVLSLLGRFETEWRKFNQGLDALGKRIERARAAYDQLAGPRRRMLERPLVRIDEIRARRGLPVAPEPTEQPEPAAR